MTRPGSGYHRSPGLLVIIGLLCGVMLGGALAQSAEKGNPDIRIKERAPITGRGVAVNDSIPTNSGRGLKAPFWVMVRSMLVPGWGQLTNRKYIKTIVVAGAEGYMLYRLYDHEMKRRDAEDMMVSRPDEAAFWEAEADRQRERRNDFTWWSAFAIALSMGDAFVDANLRYFDVEFDAQDAGEDEPIMKFQMGLRINF
ncbi:MAG: hypothetical protein KJ927_01495 [Candidatus Eisenbacteria bacterium]|nr:hypothetical protein [Candidatus Eisenbacteria bacterium]